MGELRLTLPLKNYRYISSRVGTRTDPFKKKYRLGFDKHLIFSLIADPVKRFHGGIDYVVDEGTSVFASESGKIIRADRKIHKTMGYFIVIDHTPKANEKQTHIYTTYLHLEKDSYNVSAGDIVPQGYEIAKSGNTGTRTTKPHLHFSTVYSYNKALGWNPTGNSGVGSTPTLFKDPEMFYSQTIPIDGTIYDLTDEDRKKITESLDVQMHLDFVNYSWYGDVYLGKKNNEDHELPRERFGGNLT